MKVDSLKRLYFIKPESLKSLKSFILTPIGNKARESLFAMFCHAAKYSGYRPYFVMRCFILNLTVSAEELEKFSCVTAK